MTDDTPHDYVYVGDESPAPAAGPPPGKTQIHLKQVALSVVQDMQGGKYLYFAAVDQLDTIWLYTETPVKFEGWRNIPPPLVDT